MYAVETIAMGSTTLGCASLCKVVYWYEPQISMAIIIRNTTLNLAMKNAAHFPKKFFS